MLRRIHRYILVALLFTGSAILLISCSTQPTVEDIDKNENLLTSQSDSLLQIESINGQRSMRFEALLMERYEFAKEPYMEFRKGVNVVTYDSLEKVVSTLVADYAIYYEKRKLWEAKGNVVATNEQGHILETQQLFWDQRIKKIYSNIDSKITQGEDVLYGVGFESDEAFQEWEFRRPRGRLAVDVSPTEGSDSIGTASQQVVVEEAVVETRSSKPETAITKKPKSKVSESSNVTDGDTPRPETDLMVLPDEQLEEIMPEG